MTKHKNKIFTILSAILLILSAAYFSYITFFKSGITQASFSPAIFKRAYEQSQWMVPNSKKPIGDTWLYAYAGYRYIQGENPILITPEVPPVGKYLIGLGIILTGNYQIISLLAAAFSLILIYNIVKVQTNSSLSASLAVLITTVHPLFTDQLTSAPQLEIIQCFFLLCFLWSFMKYHIVRSTYFLILSGIFLGLFIGTKLSIVFGAFSVGWLFLSFFAHKNLRKNAVKDLMIIFITAGVTYVFEYLRFFMLGGTPRGFLGMHKWIYVFYSGSGIATSKVYGSFLTLIFINKWQFWSSGFPVISYAQWSWYWPVLFVVGVAAGFLLMKEKKRSILSVLLVILVVTYSVLLFFIPIFPRYLLMLFIPLHILIGLYFDTIVHT